MTLRTLQDFLCLAARLARGIVDGRLAGDAPRPFGKRGYSQNALIWMQQSAFACIRFNAITESELFAYRRILEFSLAFQFPPRINLVAMHSRILVPSHDFSPLAVTARSRPDRQHSVQ